MVLEWNFILLLFWIVIVYKPDHKLYEEHLSVIKTAKQTAMVTMQIQIFAPCPKEDVTFSFEIDLSKLLPAAKLAHGLNIYYRAAYAHGFPLLT